MTPLLLPLAGAATLFLLGRPSGAKASPRARGPTGPVRRKSAKRAVEKAHALGLRKGRERTKEKVARAADRVVARRARAGTKPDPLGELLPKAKAAAGSWKDLATRLAKAAASKKRKAASKGAPKRRKSKRKAKRKPASLSTIPDLRGGLRLKKKRRPTARARPAARVDDRKVAAAELYKYVTQTNTKPRTWGDKRNRNAVILELQKRMGRLTADGIYGPNTRARGKALIGKTFPARR